MTIYALGPVQNGDLHILEGHPASHGGLRIVTQESDGKIAAASIERGFMNRGVEQLFPARDYRQGAMMANRHEWSAPSSGEFPFVLAVEKLLGLTPPPRAELIRVIIAELDRTSSHLLFLATLPSFTNQLLPIREKIQQILEQTTGARMHHHMITIGGIHHDIELQELKTPLREILGQLESESTDVMNFATRWHGVGVSRSEDLLSHGASGIILRANGVAADLRNDAPYSGYLQVSPPTKIKSAGDIASRIELLMAESVISIEFVLQVISAADLLTDREILQRTPKNLRLPPGQVFVNIEGALGMSGVALFSDGERAPSRVRLRTPSLGNLAALEKALVGLNVANLEIMLASWPFLPGDADR